MFGDKDRGELLFILKALYSWFLFAVILTFVFALLICKTSLDSSYIAYISSFISFTAAVSAGYSAAKYRRASRLYTGFFTALFLIILLLTSGFLIEGPKMSSGGIISVASFTFAGTMLGSNALSLFMSNNKKKYNRGKHRKAA